ncbi:MAG: amino acid adenylation domain-containing protein, partial [Algicola sp.]|nr:amino acid adenylation domain-containing protein [Algicola sp.]
MSIKDLINQCIERKIKLSVENENLKVGAPKGSMTKELLTAIKNNKSELLAFLNDYGADRDKNALSRVYPKVTEAGMSCGQRQMWFLDNALESNDAYQFYRILHIEGSIDEQVLAQAVRAIVNRHSILRTTYHDSPNGAVQRIGDATDFSMDILDLTLDSSGDADQQDIDSAHGQFKQRGFDLSLDFMLKALLIKTQSTRYQLHIKLHHIATDGWSIGLIVKDLVDFYTALADAPDHKADLNQSVPIQYIDYATWQQSESSKQNIARSLAFFEQYLADAPQMHSLPVDANKRTGVSKAGHLQRKLSNSLAQSIKSVCQSDNVTVFSFLQLGLSILISKYSNSTDIVMGTPMANRPLHELSEVVGYFVNTLPLRAEIDSGQSFRRALKAQHSRLLDVMEKQIVPFHEIVERTVFERTEGVSPLVQIMFAFQNNDIPDLRLGDAVIDVETPTAQLIDLDLNIEIVEQNAQLIVNWTYADNLFPASLIESMAIHFERLLDVVLANPDTSIKDIEILSNEEIKHLLFDLNDSHIDYPKDKCIHELFERHAADKPNNVAVMLEERQLTYRQLNEKSNQLAHYLKAHHDIKPDTLVGLCVERSLEMVIGIMAILKAGGAYVPMDPNYPQERLNYMLEDTSLEVVLSQSDVKHLLSGFNGSILTLDNMAATDCHFCHEYANSNLTVMDTGLTSSHLAYVIYTSGSTGKPKGVLIEHANAVAMLSWGLEAYSKQELAVMLASTSLNFDLSIYELFLPLCAGTSLRVVKNVLDLVSSEHVADVTLINTVPSAMDALLKASAIPDNVQVINLAGEALQNTLVNGILDSRGDIAVCNLYGPSEDTTYSTFSRFVEKRQDAPHIGRVLPNSVGLILDEDQQLVPFGVPGELYLGGDGVSRGYLNRPELTRQQYVENLCFDEARGERFNRLYRTGDIVRYLPGGDIAYLGRADHQVKIR